MNRDEPMSVVWNKDGLEPVFSLHHGICIVRKDGPRRYEVQWFSRGYWRAKIFRTRRTAARFYQNTVARLEFKEHEV